MAATTVVSRENIASWAQDSPKLYLFRRAVEEMQAVSDEALMDERGYQWVAGVHGGFGGQPFCHHGDRHFLTWHRPYVLDMELKLRAQIATITDTATADEWRLPYWDWSDPNVEGLPEAFTVQTYDDNGTTKANPLLASPYRLPYEISREELPEDPHDETWRSPGGLATLRALSADVARALDEPTFNFFSDAVQRAHNALHMWVGGFMITLRSSFDPIFWVHHANVDRHFWLWQTGGGVTSTIPDFVRQFECQPFDFADIRAEAFFDTRTLGYTYAEIRSPVQEPALAPAEEDARPAALPLDFGPIPAAFRRARIHLHGVRHPVPTSELRFFADRGGVPDASTPTTPAENFLGSFVLLGHGTCPGAAGHCDPEPDPITGAGLRGAHHLSPFDISIDVTQPLEALAPDGDLRASMIVLDANGAQRPLSTVTFDNATLTVT